MKSQKRQKSKINDVFIDCFGWLSNISIKELILFWFFVYFSLSILIVRISCSSPDENIVSSNPSVQVSGIIITTVAMPEGTGEICGSPSYPIADNEYQFINMVPNPYMAQYPFEPSPTERFVMFTHLRIQSPSKYIKGFGIHIWEKMDRNQMVKLQLK
jgi:hypothetical protein